CQIEKIGSPLWYSEGATSAYRSSQSPIRIDAPNTEYTRGFNFALRPMSPMNGTKKQRARTNSEKPPQYSSERWMIQACSHGSFPYQMTMYCEKNRYIQNTVKPKVSFPMSCRCWSPMWLAKSLCCVRR